MGSSSSSQGYVWGERRGERGGGARKPGVGGGGWGARGAGRRGLQETQFSARHKGLGRVFTFTFLRRRGGLRTDAVTSRLSLSEARFVRPPEATITRERALAPTPAQDQRQFRIWLAGESTGERTAERTSPVAACRFPQPVRDANPLPPCSSGPAWERPRLPSSQRKHDQRGARERDALDRGTA